MKHSRIMLVAAMATLLGAQLVADAQEPVSRYAQFAADLAQVKSKIELIVNRYDYEGGEENAVLANEFCKKANKHVDDAEDKANEADDEWNDGHWHAAEIAYSHACTKGDLAKSDLTRAFRASMEDPRDDWQGATQNIMDVQNDLMNAMDSAGCP